VKRKEILFAALQNKEVERIPWVPFVGCHAAKLMNVSTEDYFKSADLIVNGVKLAYEKYRPDGLPVLFDLQVEAEALGCQLKYSPTNPPSVASHPLAENPDLSGLRALTESDGRLPIVLEAIKRIKQALGEDLGIYGLITGPYTLALHLRGTEIFFDQIDNPQYVQDLMRFCTKVAKTVVAMYIEAGVDIVAVVDPMTSQISPENFEEFVLPFVTEIFNFIREKERFSSFFVCGNAKNNVENMCKSGPDNISIDENIPLGFVKEVCQRYGISFGGNIKLTVSMLFGTPADNMVDAMNCMHIGGNKGFILAPGCDMPFATPEENVEAIAALVHGDVTEISGEKSSLDLDIEVPDYENLDYVHIDIITLDSQACAPCQYMVEAVARNSGEFGEKVAWQEHKIKEKEAVALMQKLGVSSIPTTVIDGEVKFISLIPDETQVKAAIRKALEKKGL